MHSTLYWNILFCILIAGELYDEGISELLPLPQGASIATLQNEHAESKAKCRGKPISFQISTPTGSYWLQPGDDVPWTERAQEVGAGLGEPRLPREGMRSPLAFVTEEMWISLKSHFVRKTHPLPRARVHCCASDGIWPVPYSLGVQQQPRRLLAAQPVPLLEGGPALALRP